MVEAVIHIAGHCAEGVALTGMLRLFEIPVAVILARISHQAASDTDKTLVFWSEVLIVENTVCYSSLPITVQASLRVRKLVLHSNRSYCYAFRSRAALTNTNPAPASRDPGEKCGLAANRLKLDQNLFAAKAAPT